jgi:hypothetical protein
LISRSSCKEYFKKSLPVTGSIVFLCISSISSMYDPRAILSVGFITPTYGNINYDLIFLTTFATFL